MENKFKSLNKRGKSKFIQNEQKSQKEQENMDIIEDASVLQDKIIGGTTSFFEKNKNLSYGILFVVVAVVFGIFSYDYYIENENKEAQNQLFPAVFYLEKGEVDKALNGDNNDTDGLVYIADKYSQTKSGNLASFYAGVANMKQQNFEDAITYLEKFSSNDYLIQARAYALIGDAYSELEDYQNAIPYYEKAVNYKKNDAFTPKYMIKLALAYMAADQSADAKSALETLVKEYKNTPEAEQAKKHLVRL